MHKKCSMKREEIIMRGAGLGKSGVWGQGDPGLGASGVEWRCLGLGGQVLEKQEWKEQGENLTYDTILLSHISHGFSCVIENARDMHHEEGGGHQEDQHRGDLGQGVQGWGGSGALSPPTLDPLAKGVQGWGGLG